jgi:hypothetical protein
MVSSPSAVRGIGLVAWLRVLVIGVLLALAVPAMAMADDSAAGSTAVMDPPAVVADNPATASNPASEATPAAGDTTTPAPPEDATPAPVVEPPAAFPADPPAAQTPVDDGPVVEPPLVDVPSPPAVEAPVVPPLSTDNPLVPDGPVLAPSLPELAPTLLAAPDAPAVRPLSPVDVVLPPPAPRPTGASPTLGAPPTPPALSVGVAPDAPVTIVPDLPATAAPADPQDPDLAVPAGFGSPSSILSGPFEGLTPTSTAAPPSVRVSDATPPGGALGPGDVSPFSPRFDAVGGPVPVGSSLLAVLASYVLPGGGPVPGSSTLLLLLQLAVILAALVAPRPALRERLVLWGLLGARRGHRLAVCRPG